MSRVGVWPLVVEDVRSRARAAAGGGDVCSRMAAYADLCQDVGVMANGYACPKTAARLLVAEAARSYQNARRGVLV